MLFKFSFYGFLKNLQFFEPFLYLFFLKNGLSFLQIGFLISIREIAIQIFEIPTGIISDVIGKRRSMIFSFTSYIGAFLVFYFSGPVYPLYIAAMVVFALGEAFRTGTHKAIILDYLDTNNRMAEKVSYYGTTRSVSKIGSAVSALIAAVIVFITEDYNSVFLATVIPYIGGLILMLTYPKYLDTTYRTADISLWRNFLSHTKDSITSLFKIKGLGKGVINSSFYEGLFKVGKDYLQPILKAQALLLPFFVTLDNEQRVGLLTGVVYSILALGAAVASKQSHRFTSRFKNIETPVNTTYLFTALLFAAAGILVYFKCPAGAITVFVIMYLLENLRRPAVIGYLGDRMDKKQRATILSVDSQLKSLFAMIAAPLLGFFADRYGVEGALVTAGSILLLLFIPLLLKKAELTPKRD